MRHLDTGLTWETPTCGTNVTLESDLGGGVRQFLGVIERESLTASSLARWAAAGS